MSVLISRDCVQSTPKPPNSQRMRRMEIRLGFFLIGLPEGKPKHLRSEAVRKGIESLEVFFGESSA